MTKDLYKQEMQRIHKSYQQKVEKLENKTKSLEQKSKANESEEAIKAKIEQALLELEGRWIKKYDAKDSECQQERNTNAALNSKLKQYEQELSNLRTTIDESSTRFNSQLASKVQEIDRLHKHLSAVEKRLSDAQHKIAESAHSLEKALTEKHEELQNLR